ncbi:unnamed protein product [Cladocopium goreaui]|uniref:Binding protein YtlA n=1 Tax=Cladocopium goreaui TaxID=2562237 RepID=A0A9P1CGS8_9DINO|nr:unnamed protein product [Cladocopium goreaui]
MQFYGLRCTLCGWKIPTGGGTGLILPCQAASYKPQVKPTFNFKQSTVPNDCLGIGGLLSKASYHGGTPLHRQSAVLLLFSAWPESEQENAARLWQHLQQRRAQKFSSEMHEGTQSCATKPPGGTGRGRDVEAKWEDAKLLAAKLLASSTSRDTVIRNIAADGEDYLPAASVGHNMGPPQQQSLLLGHAMLWVHRWYCPDDGGSVSPTTCSRPDRHRLRILGLAQVICILLTVLSWQLEVVDVAFGGLVGTFLKVTDQPTSKTYSIMGLLSRLGKQGSTYLQVTFAVFVLIIPLLYLLAMAFLCLYQLQPKKQQLVLRLCYTLNAWAAYDVFFIAFLAAVLGGERYGIGQFIELVVYQQNLAPMCDALRDIGVQCMHVQLALLPGALLILLAVVASFLVSLLATRKLNKG